MAKAKTNESVRDVGGKPALASLFEMHRGEVHMIDHEAAAGQFTQEFTAPTV